MDSGVFTYKVLKLFMKHTAEAAVLTFSQASVNSGFSQSVLYSPEFNQVC